MLFYVFNFCIFGLIPHYIKTMNKLHCILSLITFSLFLTACSSGNSEEKDILVSPKQGKFEVEVTATGELQAKNSVNIYGPQKAAEARIYQIKISDMVAEGTRVTKGDYVARLDDSDLRSKIADETLALQQAESKYLQEKLDTALQLSEARNKMVNLKFAMEEKLAEMEQSVYEAPATRQKVKLEYEKAKREYEQETSNYQKRIAQSVAKVKDAESELIKQKRKYQELLDLRGDFVVKAPEDGMVIYHRHWNGKKIAAGSMWERWNPVIATLPDLSTMESITYINEIDIQKVRKGQEAMIQLDAMADKFLTGKVTSVANIGEQRPNSDSKVFEVHIEIIESDTTLRPAMTTSNQILVESKTDAIFIPLECLHAQDSLSYVFKMTGNRLVRQEIVPGLMNENDVEVLAGLEMEDQVYLSLPGDTTGLEFNRLEGKSQLAGDK